MKGRTTPTTMRARRVVALYVGKRIGGKATGKAIQFTIIDGSGMILVEAKDSLDQTLMRGTIARA